MAAATSIEEFLQLEKDAAQYSAKKDMELWSQWMDNGKQPEDTELLLNNFKGLIRSESNRFAGHLNIPPSAVHSQFQTQAMRAFETYDPNRGAKLSTHVKNQMKRGRRFVHTYQNLGRIPEPRIYKITDFKTNQQELEDHLGRPPTSTEMADRMKWPVKQVVAMEHELRDEIPASKFPGDIMSIKPSADAEVLRLIQYELSPDERAVFEYSTGANGKPMLKPGEISKKLNMPASKVSRLKLSTAKKIEQFRK